MTFIELHALSGVDADPDTAESTSCTPTSRCSWRTSPCNSREACHSMRLGRSLVRNRCAFAAWRILPVVLLWPAVSPCNLLGELIRNNHQEKFKGKAHLHGRNVLCHHFAPQQPVVELAKWLGLWEYQLFMLYGLRPEPTENTHSSKWGHSIRHFVLFIVGPDVTSTSFTTGAKTSESYQLQWI